MKPHTASRSDALLGRAKAVIPGGIFGHLGAGMRPGGPKFFARADGARFQDVDGNEYIDYLCAFGPTILGYNHAPVDEAAARQQRLGNAVSLAAPVMVELAELLVEKVAAADWALFGKNGTDATSLAVMVARAATGRAKIVTVRGGYHGVAPWMRAGHPGHTPADGADVLSVPWNDADALARLFGEHPGAIAGFISSPYHHPVLADNALPAEGYWARVEALCRAEGVVLITDDVRAGFRIDLAGSNVAFGYTPDLVCFGKAIANGHPLAALVGADALKQTASEVFYTGTQFFSGPPMAAAIATIKELEAADGVRRIGALGSALSAGLVDVASTHGHRLVASGPPSMPYFRLADVPREGHFAWIDECVKRGAYFLGFHNHFLSAAHTEADVERTCEIADAAFKALGKAAWAA